jgi:3-hydroxyacyl-[acyl-carrier-protein] dehydratase
MLLNSFYEINEQSASAAGDRTILSAQITINKTHPIFQGHFPGMPVVPGVCMIQIVKEIFESHTKLSVSMTDAGNIKFLSVINPEINNELNVEISFKENSGSYDIDARLYFNETVFFKIKCILSVIA